MSPSLSLLIELSRQAGQILRERFWEPHQVHYKGDIDLVTEADQRSEAYLIEQIRSRFPNHTIVSEESGLLSGEESHAWYIDPLDGTTNYAHGVPIYSVSIAYAHNGQLQLGVIYDPMQDECFTAERGKGAWLNERPMRVSDVQDLNHSLLVTGFPYDIRTNPQTNLDNYAYFAKHSQAVRRLGSAALDTAYVAAGRLDGYWEISTKAWDIAAGVLMVQEAGGVVTNIEGGKDFFHPPYAMIAAPPALHPQILQGLNRNGKAASA